MGTVGECIVVTWSSFLICRMPLGPNPGFEAVHPVVGPMGRSVADLERVARVLFGERSGGQDYFPAPVPYRDVTLPKTLRFGYYLNGAFMCHLHNSGFN
jgi:Asp-tRNA(Asn)/Glu-tRNA(Gln) amidotransferase A subunit family amidase